jgi:hypothetical protein
VFAAFLVVAAAVFLTHRDPKLPLSSDEPLIGIEILQREDPNAFAADPLVTTRFYPSLYLYFPLLKAFWDWTGDFVAAHQWLLGLLVFLHLAGCYALLHGVTGNAPASALVSVFALGNRLCLGADTWGIYDLDTVSARSLFMPFGFLLMLGFLRWRDDPAKVRWLFGALGLLGMVHTVSVYWLVQILGLTFLIHRGWSWRTVRLALADAVFFIIGMLPLLFSLQRFTSAGGVAIDAPFAKILEVCRYRWGWAFYPIALERLALIAAHLLPPLLLAAAGLRARLKTGADASDRWLWWFGGLSVAVSLLEPALQQLICAWLEKFPPMIEQFRGFRFLYVVIFIYIARLVAAVLQSSQPVWKRAVWLAVIAACIYAYPSKIKRLIPPPMMARINAALRVQPVTINSDWQLAYYTPVPSFLALCDWARTQTPPDSLFLYDNFQFRFYARRAMVGPWKDGSFALARGPQSLLAWHEKNIAITRAYDPPDPAALLALARRFKATHVVLPAACNVPGLAAVFRNEVFAVYAASPPAAPAP